MWLIMITFISLMLAPEENSEDQKSLRFRVSHRDVQFRSTACFIFSVHHVVGPHSSSHDVSELISSIVVVQGPRQNQASDPHWVLTSALRPCILCSDPAVSAPRQAADASTRAAQLSRPLGRRRRSLGGPRSVSFILIIWSTRFWHLIYNHFATDQS